MSDMNQENVSAGSRQADDELQRLFDEAAQTIDLIRQRRQDVKTTDPPAPDQGTEQEQREQELQERENDYLREKYEQLMFEFRNYKDRHARQQQLMEVRVRMDLLTEFLGVVDVAELAQNSINNSATLPTLEGIQQGVGLLFRSVQIFLEKSGVRRIPTRNALFDPMLHQAAAVEEVAGLAAQTVIQEIQPGYVMEELLLRPALVKVGIPPSPNDGSSE